MQKEEFLTHHNFGDLYRDKKEFDKAIDSYEEAIKLKADNFLTHLNLADCYREKGEFDKAIGAYEAAKKSTGANFSWADHHHLGDCYREKGKFGDAIASYQQAILLSPDPDDNFFTYFNLGSCYRETIQFNDAIKYYEEARKRANNFYVYHYLGDCYREKKQLDKAIDSYEEAIKLKADNFLTHLNLADCYREKGEFEDAIKCYEEARKLANDFYVYHYLGDCYRETKQLDKAIDSYKEAIKLKPDNFLAHLNLADCYREKGEFNKAIGAYGAANKSTGANFSSTDHHHLGDCYREKGKFKDAIASYQQAILLNTNLNNNFFIYFNLGSCYRETTQFNDAIQYYKKACKLANDFYVYHYLGDCYRETKQFDKAIDSYEEAIKLNNNNFLTHLNLANCYRETRDFDKAIASYLHSLFLQLKDSVNTTVSYLPGLFSQLSVLWYSFDLESRKQIQGVAATALGLIATHYIKRFGERFRLPVVQPPIPRGVVAGGAAIIMVGAEMKGGHADYTSLDAHPLKDLYKEMWSESQLAKGKSGVISLKPLLMLDNKSYMTVDSSYEKQESQETPLAKPGINSSFNQSLSANDYFGVVVPYVSHYVRKYSSWTLPWNKEKSLSKQDKQQLNAALKKRKHLEANFSSQQKSRAAGYSFLFDKIYFIEKELSNLESGVNDLLKKGKATPSQLSKVQSRMERVEEVIRQLSVNNKKLGCFEEREQRIAKYTQQTAQPMHTILHYNVTQNCLKQEVAYEDSPSLLSSAENAPLKMELETSSVGGYQFARSQQFWGQPVATSSSPRMRQGESRVEDTALLNKTNRHRTVS